MEDHEIFKQLMEHIESQGGEKPEIYHELVRRMKLKLNLGCGSQRPKDRTWINIDNLHKQFPDPECLERQQLAAERNYLEHDVAKGLPMFDDNSISGIFASHFCEHFDCLTTVKIFRECHRVLKPGGVIRISSPDPQKFHKLTLEGCTDWGQPHYDQEKSFMEYALFFGDHKQILGLDTLWCMFYTAGFRKYEEKAYSHSWLENLAELDNREVFSTFVEAMKDEAPNI